MRRSVPPEQVQAAETRRAAMAAAAHHPAADGVLVPPGTSVVILSFDGPVDVQALYRALGVMIGDGDLRGIPLETLGAVPVQSGTRDGTEFWIDEGGHTRLGRPQDDSTARAAANAILKDAHDYGQSLTAAAFADDDEGEDEDLPLDDEDDDEPNQPDDHLDAFAIPAPAPEPPPATPQPVEPAAPVDNTPLGHLRRLGPASAVELAASLGITRQKAVLELAALVRDGDARKEGRRYVATGVNAASIEA